MNFFGNASADLDERVSQISDTTAERAATDRHWRPNAASLRRERCRSHILAGRVRAHGTRDCSLRRSDGGRRRTRTAHECRKQTMWQLVSSCALSFVTVSPNSALTSRISARTKVCLGFERGRGCWLVIRGSTHWRLLCEVYIAPSLRCMGRGSGHFGREDEIDRLNSRSMSLPTTTGLAHC